MKKLLTVAAVLMAAAMFFTGCKNAANSDDGGEDLPGTWVSTVDYYEANTGNPWSNNKNKVSFSCSNATSLGIEEGYSSTYSCAVSPTQLYGVRAKVKQNAFTKAEPGLILFLTTTGQGSNTKFDTYYSLTFYKGSYTLYEKESGKESVCLSTSTENGETYENTWHDAIKQEGNSNEVLFYTDGNKLVLKINGTKIATIDKKLDSGKTSACMFVPGGISGAINANWEFLEFQTGK